MAIPVRARGHRKKPWPASDQIQLVQMARGAGRRCRSRHDCARSRSWSGARPTGAHPDYLVADFSASATARCSATRPADAKKAAAFFRNPFYIHSLPTSSSSFLHPRTLAQGKGWSGSGFSRRQTFTRCPGFRAGSQDTDHLGNGCASRDHHLHCLSLELRAESPTMLWHRTDPCMRAQNHCPRYLIQSRG